MLAKSTMKLAVARFLAGMVVLGLGVFGGAALSLSNAADRSQEAATNRIAALGAPILLEPQEAILVVEESPRPSAPIVQSAPPAAQVQPAARRTSKVSAASAAAPAVAVPSGSSGPADCDRLDDLKINWLLRLVAKTKAANPSDSAIADRLDAHLRTGLGKGLCAEEAQKHISNMCADRAVHAFMQKMVKELPFFVRPMVGDPCKHDLVKVAQKYLP